MNTDVGNPSLPAEPRFKYWAFVSYSHRDRKWGGWVHRAIETYRVPKRLVGTIGREGKIPARLLPIFRDREELPTSADLGENIRHALEGSSFLIVVCSPVAAQSRWVNEEILTFKRLGRENHILPLIVAGEPNASDGKPGFEPEQECFPRALRLKADSTGELTEERTEPIAADARSDADGRSNAKLKLIAGILGVDYDLLRRRELARKVRRLQLLSAAALIVIAGFAILGAYAWHQKTTAQTNEILASDRKVEADTERDRIKKQQVDLLVSSAAEDLRNGRRRPGLLLLTEALKLNPSHREARSSLLNHLVYEKMAPAANRFPIPAGDSDIEFNADGTIAFVWAGSIGKVIDVATGNQIGSDLEHDFPPKDAYFLNNGQILVTSGQGSIRDGASAYFETVYWDLSVNPARPRKVGAGGFVGLDEVHQRAVVIDEAEFGPDQATEYPLMEIGSEGGRTLRGWSDLALKMGVGSSDDSIDLDPTGHWLVTKGRSQKLLKYPSRNPILNMGSSDCYAFSRDGTKVGVIKDQRLTVLQFSDPVQQTYYSIRSAPYNSLQFTSDALKVAAADENGLVTIWDIRDQRIAKPLGQVALNRRDNWILTDDLLLYSWQPGASGLLYLTDFNSPPVPGEDSETRSFYPELVYDGGEISTVEPIPKKGGVGVLWKEGLGAFFKGTLKAGMGTEVMRRSTSRSSPISARFDPTGTRLACWSYNSDVWYLHETLSGKELDRNQQIGFEIQSIDLNKGGEWALVNTEKRTDPGFLAANRLCMFDPVTQTLKTQEVPKTSGTDVRWHFTDSGQQLIAQGTDNKKNRILNVFRLPAMTQRVMAEVPTSLYPDEFEIPDEFAFNSIGTEILHTRRDGLVELRIAPDGQIKWSKTFGGRELGAGIFGNGDLLIFGEIGDIDRRPHIFLAARSSGDLSKSFTVLKSDGRLAVSDDNSLLGVSTDSGLYVYSLPSGSLRVNFEQTVNGFSFLPGTHVLGSGGEYYDCDSQLPLVNLHLPEKVPAVSPAVDMAHVSAVLVTGELIRFDLAPAGDELVTDNFSAFICAYVGVNVEQGRPHEELNSRQKLNDVANRLRSDPPSIYKTVAFWLLQAPEKRSPNPFAKPKP